MHGTVLYVNFILFFSSHHPFNPATRLQRRLRERFMKMMSIIVTLINRFVSLYSFYLPIIKMHIFSFQCNHFCNISQPFYNFSITYQFWQVIARETDLSEKNSFIHTREPSSLTSLLKRCYNQASNVYSNLLVFNVLDNWQLRIILV